MRTAVIITSSFGVVQQKDDELASSRFVSTSWTLASSTTASIRALDERLFLRNVNWQTAEVLEHRPPPGHEQVVPKRKLDWTPLGGGGVSVESSREAKGKETARVCFPRQVNDQGNPKV